MEQDEGFPVARGDDIEAVCNTLTEAGIVFIDENGGGVGVRLRKPVGASKPDHVTKAASLKKARPRRS